MGNCCSGSSTGMNGTAEPVESHTALVEHSAPIAVPDDTVPVEEEPRVLEHIADREGKEGRG